MERLTDTSIEDVRNNLDAFDIMDWEEDIYNKLAEYEDFMEENGFESLEDIKQQLAEKDKQLENAIVPKFKVGDVLWYIRCDKVEKFIVYEARCDCVFYYVNEDGVDVDEYKLFATKQEAEEALKKLKGSE